MSVPHLADKYRSELLSIAQLQNAMEAIPEVFRKLLGECIVTAYYGFGTNIHNDLQYVPMRVGTRWINEFIIDSIERGIVIPGGSDFSFNTPNGQLQVLFCHERDIHLSGYDDDIIQQFISELPFSGIRFCQLTTSEW